MRTHGNEPRIVRFIIWYRKMIPKVSGKSVTWTENATVEYGVRSWRFAKWHAQLITRCLSRSGHNTVRHETSFFYSLCFFDHISFPFFLNCLLTFIFVRHLRAKSVDWIRPLHRAFCFFLKINYLEMYATKKSLRVNQTWLGSDVLDIRLLNMWCCPENVLPPCICKATPIVSEDVIMLVYHVYTRYRWVQYLVFEQKYGIYLEKIKNSRIQKYQVQNF